MLKDKSGKENQKIDAVSLDSSSNLDGQREGGSPLADLLAEVLDLRDGIRGNLGLEVLELVGLLGQLALDLLGEVDGLVDVASHALEVLLAQTTAGHGRGTDTETARGQSGLVTGDGVLVACDVDLLKNSLDTSTIQTLGAEVQQDHVAVGTVGDELVAESLELELHGLGVLDNLLLVLAELRSGGLLEGHGKGSDSVVVRTTLVSGEHREVDGTLKVIHDVLTGLGVSAADTLAEEDHGTTRTTERLVSGGGHDISVLERRWDHTSGNQTGNVSHVDDEVGTDGIGDLAHARIVDQTAVGGGTGNKALGAVELGVGLEGVIVDDASLQVNTVGEGLEVGRDSGDPGAVVNTIARQHPRKKGKTYFFWGVW